MAGQIRAIAWSTFEWREGTYEFQLGKPPGRARPDPDRDGRPRARGDAARLHPAAAPGRAARRTFTSRPSPDPAFELYALGLRAREARLLALADGTKSVADLLQLSDLPERDALAFLQACRVMRVLDDAERVLASTRRIAFM